MLDVAGRSREAAEAARRAVDLEPSDARDSLLRRLDVTVARRTALLGEASSGPVDVPAPEGILADGLPALDAADRAAADEAAADAEEPASEAQPSPPTVASDTPRSQAYDALDALRAGIATKEDGDADSAAGESVDPAADVAAEPAGAGAAEAAAPGDPAPSTDEGVETDGQRVDAAEEPGADRPWPPIDLPSPPTPPIVGPPPDPEALLAEAALVLESSEIDAARDLMLTAVQVHREAGRLDAALEVCLDLLAIAPGDPRVHLAIANLQLDRGWTGVATEKIDLLVRLTSLTGDTQAEADVHGLASERLRDDPATTPAGH